jgi:hypothetical protein
MSTAAAPVAFPCSCGNAEPHTIARRQTADGKHVCLWDDGSLTWALGNRIRGSAEPRTEEQRRIALAAGRLVLGEVVIWDSSEITTLVKAARWVAARGGLPGDVRARVRAESAPRFSPLWTTEATDRDGRATARVWRLPRLTHPGVAVWDEAHPGGRYSIWTQARGVPLSRSGAFGDTYAPTGVRFKTLKALFAYLAETSSLTSHA